MYSAYYIVYIPLCFLKSACDSAEKFIISTVGVWVTPIGFNNIYKEEREGFYSYL